MIKKGPKGRAVFKELFPFNNFGIEYSSPKIDAVNKITKIDLRPNIKPSPDNNLASPKPIASTFFIFLYKNIIIQINK